MTTGELFTPEVPEESLPRVELWTDGGCSKNPGGDGAWAFVLVSAGGNTRQESGYIPAPTTNNRAEWMAVLEGLKRLKKRCRVLVRSDSMICVNAINNRGKKMHKRGNQDLVQEFLAIRATHIVEAQWVQGHMGHKYNEICDGLCAKEMGLVK